MISRRVFLRNGSLALVSLGFAPSFLARTAAASGNGRKVLIAIFQRGAVDGLNMVVPFGERAYYSARPSIAIAQPGAADDTALDLDGFFGFHPRLSPLKPLYDRRELAVVHACGSHDSTRSHFDAQDYMESGTPGVKSTRDGWLNRYLQAREVEDATAFRAVALAQQMPRTLHGRAPALAMNRIERFGIRAGRQSETIQASFEAEYAAAASRLLSAAGQEAFEAIKMLDARSAISPSMVPNIRARPTASHSGRSRSSSRQTSVSRSPLPRRATGTITSTKGPPRGSSPTVSTIWRAESRRSPRTSETACNRCSC